MPVRSIVPQSALPSVVVALARDLFGVVLDKPGVHTIPADIAGYVWHCVVAEDRRLISFAAIPEDLATRETIRAFFAWKRSCPTASAPRLALVVDVGRDGRR
jgi:hypothetical protein